MLKVVICQHPNTQWTTFPSLYLSKTIQLIKLSQITRESFEPYRFPSKQETGVNSQFQSCAFSESFHKLPLPGCSLQFFLPCLLPPSLILLCSREEMLKDSPASQQAPPAVPATGTVRSHARPNCTRKALPISPSRTLKPRARDTFQRSGAHPSLKNEIFCAQLLPQLTANHINQGTQAHLYKGLGTSTRHWKPRSVSSTTKAPQGSSVQSPGPTRKTTSDPAQPLPSLAVLYAGQQSPPSLLPTLHEGRNGLLSAADNCFVFITLLPAQEHIMTASKSSQLGGAGNR